MYDDLLQSLTQRFSIQLEKQQRADQIYIRAEKKEAVSLLTHLKQFEGFTHLSFFTAVDLIEKSMFELKYMLHNYDRNLDLCVSVAIERPSGKEMAEMDSIHHLWPTAVTYEQELAEMFGIHFPFSPRVGTSFILEGWDDLPPMRRDFDTQKYSEDTYYERPGRETHDPAEHLRKEIYPSEAEKW